MKESKIKKLLFDEFMKWMRGQTVSSYPNGDINFYEHDVMAFIEKIKTGYDRQTDSGAWD